jgi:hypothetical protein
LGWPKLLDASLHVVRVMVAMGGKGCKNMYHRGAAWLHLYQTKAKTVSYFLLTSEQFTYFDVFSFSLYHKAFDTIPLRFMVSSSLITILNFLESTS